ncbi:diphosphomevalonate decarboxylase, partial [mine drainage metagenome]
RAQAQPNIALVKYWGKQNIPGNIPAVGSLSITLDALRTQTTVRFDPEIAADVFVLNGENNPSGLPRVSRCLDLLRQEAGTSCRAYIESDNNFPTAAGLASSASGFAALVMAAGKALGLEVTRSRYAQWARQGSGSAARSIYGGFVEMKLSKRRSDVITEPLLDAEEWPLEVVVAITHTHVK